MNILEILKHKPLGTKLWSPAYGNVTLGDGDMDYILPVQIRFYNKGMADYETECLKADGTLGEYDNAECILFPSKYMRDWSRFSFKRGDVVQIGKNEYAVFVEFTDSTYTKCRLYDVYDSVIVDMTDQVTVIDTLKCEKVDDATAQKILSEIERLRRKQNKPKPKHPECKFKMFDHVLVRCAKNEMWTPQFFMRYRADMKNTPYETLGLFYKYCIPYEGNEHLAFTTNSPDSKEDE